jgi:hypothetical protein
MTVGDVGWTLLFLALLLPLMSGAMILAVAYLTPAILGSPNSLPRQGLEALVEFALLFGGMGVGMLVSLLLFFFLTCRFLGAETRLRWQLQFEGGAANMSPLHRALGRFVMKHL